MHCGKRRNGSFRAISPFPSVFSKDLYCRLVKTRACLGKGYKYFFAAFDWTSLENRKLVFTHTQKYFHPKSLTDYNLMPSVNAFFFSLSLSPLAFFRLGQHYKCNTFFAHQLLQEALT